MLASTPRNITPSIRQFCELLVPESEPQFINVTPIAGGKPNDCFPIIEARVASHGGAIRYGWQIAEWANVMLEAIFHAVWEDSSGTLHDLTPREIPTARILFLPDPKRVYDGRQVNNVRYPLTSSPNIKKFIDACDAEFELMNRGIRAEQHGEVELSGEEAEEFHEISERKMLAYIAILGQLRPPGRNDPCPCGSGKKLKKCHGR